MIQTTEDGDPLLATGGLYAPAICHHAGITYIVCTNVLHVEGESNPLFENFIISTSDIQSNEWSQPVYFEFNGIDPSLFFDDDERAYIQGSSYTTGPPWVSRIGIDCFEIDVKSGEKLSEQKEIWEGFSKIVPEGPHIYKRDGWYYLIVAEGGTSEDHRITIARSKSIWGPYESYNHNPILDVCDNKAYVSHTGHGDLFHDIEGNWWIVCLGVRKNDGVLPMGRETFIAPVQWHEGGWPALEPITLNPNMTLKGNIEPWGKCSSLGQVDLVYIREPVAEHFQVSENGKSICLKPHPSTLTDPVGPISFIGKRRRELDGESKVSLTKSLLGVQGLSEAGLAYYKDEFSSVRIFWSAETSSINFKLESKFTSSVQSAQIKVQPQGPIELRISYTFKHLEFSFSEDGFKWTLITSIESRHVSHADFVGPIIGVYAIGGSKSEFVKFNNLKVD